ncbi:MAG: sortase [Anaerolineae bacterium]|nr:sortase [Anaerolineae bacterium]
MTTKTARKHRSILLLCLALILFLTGSAPAFTTTDLPATLPLLGGGSASGSPYGDSFVLHIPSIGLEVDVWEAYVRRDTWDFSVFTHQAAHLQLTALPGQGSNVVIGAHYELADFQPGPFINLDAVPVGEQITLNFQGQRYIYEVTETMLVRPENIEIAYRTSSEMLTLLTCYAYRASSGQYEQRYVVRASLIDIQ